MGGAGLRRLGCGGGRHALSVKGECAGYQAHPSDAGKGFDLREGGNSKSAADKLFMIKSE